MLCLNKMVLIFIFQIFVTLKIKLVFFFCILVLKLKYRKTWFFFFYNYCRFFLFLYFRTCFLKLFFKLWKLNKYSFLFQSRFFILKERERFLIFFIDLFVEAFNFLSFFRFFASLLSLFFWIHFIFTFNFIISKSSNWSM